MNYFFPIFGLFLIFTAWFTFQRRKSSRLNQQAKDDFWARESEANNTRRVPLDSLTYITVSDHILLNNLSAAGEKDEILNECNDILVSLQSERIFNLTGMTSTDIKLKYGPANLGLLDKYDTNFTELVKTIYQFGERLNSLGYVDDAIKVLEFGIDSLTDISGNYKLLAELYVKKNQADKIDYLKKTAKNLNSLNQKSITNMLKEYARNL